MKYLNLLFIVFFITGCSNTSRVEKEISRIPMEFELVRFDQQFASARPSDLSRLKREYPDFFPKQYPDSVWIAKMNDTLQNQLNTEVAKIFSESDELQDGLEDLFKHIAYYFPEFKAPTVYTVTSDVDYKNKVILVHDKLILALDTYLGAENYLYEGMKKYIVKNLDKKQVFVDVAGTYAKQLVQYPRERSFVAQMVYYGKQLYLNDLWLPNEAESTKMGYTDDEFKWVVENEQDIWRYFIERELLYSTDAKLIPRFISPAPFSKFYLEIDNESPGRVGQYIGLQIVKSFMEKNNVEVSDLMHISPEEIFKKSKYKPNK